VLSVPRRRIGPDDAPGVPTEWSAPVGDEYVYVQDFAIQVGSIWVAIPVLVAVVFGLWKGAKIVWAAISN
jgi:hypothetical protein